MTVHRRVTVGLVSLGCAKNLIDSEGLLGSLAGDDRFLVGASPDEADIVIVNTCGFLEEAREESLDAIRTVLEHRASGQVQAVVVAGCLAQGYLELLEEEAPGVDAVLGVGDRDRILAICRQLARADRDRRPHRHVSAPDWPAPQDRGRLRLTPRHYAYVRTSEGCDHRCTFCTIPSIRGAHRSRPLPDVVAEVEELVSDGVREVILVGQDTTAYGLDLAPHGPRLDDLLEALGQVPGLCWLRVQYAHPASLTPPLVEALTSLPRVVPYLDIPIQHAADSVLRRMGRRTTQAQLRALLGELRSRSPGRFFLRTTVIAGFPGESEADLEELLSFLQEVRFERLGCFAYSPEAGTPAARLPGQLPRAEREARQARVLEAQQAIAFEVAREMVGQELEALVDQVDANHQSAQARTWGDGPEGDPVLHLREPPAGLRAGDLVLVQAEEAAGYDLVGRVIRPLARKE